MASLEQQSIDWIGRAAFSVTGRATTSASPEAIFAILADHERWPEWFPNVKKVEVLGPAEGVGARRRVHIPGAAVDEIFITWDEGKRWTFTGTDAKPRFVRALVEDCVLEPHGDGGTAMAYTMYFEPPRALKPLMKLVQGQLAKNIEKGMRALATRAEAGGG